MQRKTVATAESPVATYSKDKRQRDGIWKCHLVHLLLLFFLQDIVQLNLFGFFLGMITSYELKDPNIVRFYRNHKIGQKANNLSLDKSSLLLIDGSFVGPSIF